MARLRGHRALDPDRPLFVKRGPIELDGRTLQHGDSFPWRQLAVSPRRLFMLFDQRRIGHEQPHERNGAESVTELSKRPRVRKPRPA